jgi:hypothetical protein
MNYSLKGNLRGFYCGDYSDFLRHVKIRAYTVDAGANLAALAVSREKESFHQRTPDELKSLSNRLLVETITDESGNFTLEFSDKVKYEGGAFDIDFEIGTDWAKTLLGPDRKSPKTTGPFQFHITTLQPLWKTSQKNENDRRLSAYWEYAISNKFWCWILKLFGLYVICGKVKDCKNDTAVSGVKVFAYDVDLIQDDYLGFGVTDTEGNVKIYYSEADFSKTIFNWLNVEWPAGPDLYFRIEAGDGTVLLNENRQRGHDRDRTNASNCFCIDFCVECPKGSLVCGLTDPTGCINSNMKLLDDKYIAIIGTASGCGMSKYDIQLLWNGTDDVSSGAIVYSNNSGNPDPALSHGAHGVMNANLGFINLKKAIENAGSNLITAATFVVKLTVHSANGSVCTASISFSIDVGEVYIKSVGGRIAHDVTDPDEQLRVADAAGADLGAIGGYAGIWGAARVYGCANQKISNYGIYAIKDNFASVQPDNGTAFDPLLNGYAAICYVDYNAGFGTFTPDQLRQWNILKGPGSLISNNGFYPYDNVLTIPWMGGSLTIHVPEALVAGMYWPTAASGKYTLLLKVVDTLGYTYYDTQRVWVDNEPIAAVITDIGNLPPCADLYTKDVDGAFKVVNINGTAFDPLIIAGDLTNPSDNFNQYRITIQKQGSPPEEIYNSSTPVPARSGPASTNLFSFDLTWLNTTAHTPGVHDNKLLPGESCAFVFRLWVSDKTMLNNATDVHHLEYDFPVKIINSNQP